MVEASRIALSIVADPVNPCWQLTPVADGQVWLLTWQIDPWPIDAGLPEPLASVFAEALCMCGVVAHLSPPFPGLAPQQGWTRSADHPSRWHHAVRDPLMRRVIGRATPLSLTATADPATAAEGFDTVGFDWSQQGQIVFLLPSGDLPPVDGLALAQLMDGSPASARSLSGEPVLRGLMLPGVDGAVAQIVAFDPGLWPELEPALRSAATQRDVAVRAATEAEVLTLNLDTNPAGS